MLKTKKCKFIFVVKLNFYREYNELNQLIRIRQGNTSNGQILEEYEWHPLEERIVIKKIYNNSILQSTIYYPNQNYVYIVNSSGSYNEKYIYQDGVLVAQVNSDGQKQAIHSDNKGSNTLITDSTGAVVENTFYSPFGEIISGGKGSRFGYESKEYDSTVEDIDFHFRKYNPKQPPIFNQPDTLIQNIYDPQSLNRYSFERNNPYNKVDRNGHQPQSQAEGEYVNGILEEIWEAKRIRQFINEERLNIQLHWEYSHEKNPSGQTMYGTNDQVPSFEELQKIDLRKNFIPI